MARIKSSSTTISVRFDNENVPAGIEVLREFAKMILEKMGDTAPKEPATEAKNEH
jgi:hypothetical protein